MHVNSQPGCAAGSLNDSLYLARADGKDLPILNWDPRFAAESEDCLKVNNSSVTMNTMASTDAGLYINFKALAVDDTITIGGSFYCDAIATRLIIEESAFVWTSEGWKKGVVYKTQLVVYR